MSVSLSRYLVEEQRAKGKIPPELRLLLEVVARACKGMTASAAAFRRRRARLRATALPTLRLTVKPTRRFSLSVIAGSVVEAGELAGACASCGRACRIRPGAAHLRPWLATMRNSRRRLRRSRTPIALGGETLAALLAAIGKHRAATDGRHARAEAVPTLADEDAGLVSALHGKTPSDGLKLNAGSAV